MAAGAMPSRGETWEVKGPDGSVVTLSHTVPEARPKVVHGPPQEEVRLDFAQVDSGSGPLPDIPVYGHAPKAAVLSRASRPSDLRDPNAFGIRVEDDDLEPRYRRGQILLVDTTLAPGDGDSVVADLADGRRVIGVWKRLGAGKIRLAPCGAANPSVQIAESKIRSAHKVVWAKEP